MAHTALKARPNMRLSEMKPRRGQSGKWRLFLLAALLVVLLFTSVGGVLAYRASTVTYPQDMAMAQQGIQHLERAVTLLRTLQHDPLNTTSIGQARLEFSTANSDFSTLSDAINAIPTASDLLPVYGAKLHAARFLLPAAQHLARAGLAGCMLLSLLGTAFHNPWQSSGLTKVQMVQVMTDVQQAMGELQLAINAATHLQAADVQFDARIAKAFAQMQQYLPMVKLWMTDLTQLLPALPAILGVGTPSNYLIELLDSTELRPGGGFVGNYGIATLSGGHLLAADITDVDLLDRPFYGSGGRIPYPPQYQWFSNFLATSSWSLRDSNLDADFPTAAHYAETNYALEGGKGTFQGVIAITPQFIEQALAITGPVSVPEYQQVVTASNLIDLIHYYQLGAGAQGPDTVASPDGHSSLRKRFTSLLALHFMQQLRQMPTARWPALVQLLLHGLQAKDIQLSFNAPAAEQALHQLQFDGAIEATSGDEVMLVDANVAGDKANHYIQNVVHDQVTLDAQGDALHHLSMHYSWTTPGNIYGTHLYRDYLRVYVPKGSVLHRQNGWTPSTTSKAYGYTVWSGVFTLSFGQTLTINLSWTVPAVATYGTAGWHYSELVQRQAGITRSWQMQLVLPTCARNVRPSGSLRLLATNTVDGVDMAAWAQPLTQNNLSSVEYLC